MPRGSSDYSRRRFEQEVAHARNAQRDRFRAQFREMSELEVIEWLNSHRDSKTAGRADADEARKAKEAKRLLTHGLESQPGDDDPPPPEPPPPQQRAAPTQLTPLHLAILALPIAAFGAVTAALGVVAGVIAAVAVGAVVLLRPVRASLVRFIDRILAT
jgi:hypothetical protein